MCKQLLNGRYSFPASCKKHTTYWIWLSEGAIRFSRLPSFCRCAPFYSAPKKLSQLAKHRAKGTEGLRNLHTAVSSPCQHLQTPFRADWNDKPHANIWIRSIGLRFESSQEHNKTLSAFQKCCADSLSVYPTPVCIRMHKNDHLRTQKIL